VGSKVVRLCAQIKYIADPGMHSIPSVAVHPNGKWLCGQSLDNQIVTYSALDKFRQNRKKVFKGHSSSGYACQVCVLDPDPDTTPDPDPDPLTSSLTTKIDRVNQTSVLRNDIALLTRASSDVSAHNCSISHSHLHFSSASFCLAIFVPQPPLYADHILHSH
jgi:hypothetical protein